MGPLQKVIAVIITLSLITFVALFGSLPAFRKTPIGLINRLIWIKVPGLLLTVDLYLSGGRCISFLKCVGRYLMNENHPLILIFYLSLLIGSEFIFIRTTWPRLSFGHRLATMVIISMPYFFTYKSVWSATSVVTANSHSSHMRQYPYDYVLFQPGKVCSTCQLLKPARSKHCSICKVCVAKHDHHCIWVMNCLGRGNYGFFIAMLLSLSVLLTYGAYLSYLLLDGTMQNDFVRQNSGTTEPTVHWSAGIGFQERVFKWGWVFTEDINVGSVGLLAIFTAPLAWGLFGYHVYLIWAGMTTNESFKWDEWKDDIYDGFVYKHSEPNMKAKDTDDDPYVNWPLASKQSLVNLVHRQPVSANEQSELINKGWNKVQDLQEVENIYDLGFLRNFKDILHTI